MGQEFLDRRPDVSMATIEQYLHNLYRVRPTSCTACRATSRNPPDTDAVLPDDIVAHRQVSIDIASLAPNAEITVFPEGPGGPEGPHHQRARAFLKRHQTA